MTRLKVPFLAVSLLTVLTGRAEAADSAERRPTGPAQVPEAADDPATGQPAQADTGGAKADAAAGGDLADAGASATDPPSESAAAPLVAPPGQVLCVLEYYPARAADTSNTIARMICDELRAKGVPATQPVVDAEYTGSAYAIRLERLGETILIVLRQDSESGETLRTQTLGVGRPEEAKQAVPRLVDALVNNKKLDDTRSFDTVTDDEVKKRKQLSGEWITGVGLVASSAPVNDPAVGAGVEFFGYYETSGWGVGLGFVGGGMGSDGRVTTGFLGARKYFSDTGFDWFAGAGVGLAGFATDELEGDGFGFFGEFGMELFRLYSTHMTTFIRADMPAYRLKPLDGSSAGASWEVPLSLHVNLGW